VLFRVDEGGLVKGLENNEVGGIYILAPAGNDRFYEQGFIFPGCYISHYKSFKENKTAFSEIETSIDNFLNFNFKEFTIPESCKIIDTKNNLFSFLLISELSQFVFTKNSVINNLEKI